MKETKSAVIIQARMSSERLPGKSMSLLGGIPLVEHVYKRCRGCLADMVIVATSNDPSDDMIHDHCVSRKIPVFRGSLDNVLERYIMAADSVLATHIVRVCADTPFVDTALIDKILKVLITENLDYVSLARPTCASCFYSEAMTLNALKRVAELADNKDDLEHVTKYITAHPDKFLTRFIDAGLNPAFMRDVRLTVDHPGDLEAANAIVGDLGDPIIFTSKEVMDVIANRMIGSRK